MMAKGKKIKKAKKLEEGDIVFFNVNNETVVAIVDKMKDDDSFDLIYVSKEHGVTVGSSAYPPFAGNFKSAVRITSDKELKNIRKEHKKAVKDAEKKQKEIEKAEKKEKQHIIMPEEYDALCRELKEKFNARVKLSYNEKGKGKVVIPFDSDDDLMRLMSLFDKIN